MIELKERFDELRAVERRGAPAFAIAPRRRHFQMRWAFALLLIVVIIAIRPHRSTTFSNDDREAARAISSWHAPTDVLLKGTIR